MQPKDWQLLMIAAAGERGLSPVQLQKSLFLIGQNIKPDAFYSFEPYDYGPFARPIYSDARELAHDGLIAIQGGDVLPQRRYTATPLGKDRADEMRRAIGPENASYIDTLAQWILSLTFESLLRSIYTHFPAYATKSVFRGG